MRQAGKIQKERSQNTGTLQINQKKNTCPRRRFSWLAKLRVRESGARLHSVHQKGLDTATRASWHVVPAAGRWCHWVFLIDFVATGNELSISHIIPKTSNLDIRKISLKNCLKYPDYLITDGYFSLAAFKTALAYPKLSAPVPHPPQLNQGI